MQNLFESSKRESAVDIVVNSIKQLLIDGRLKPGDRLPKEMEISEGLGVSRGSVREAMKVLSALGLVDVKVGNGTYVSESLGNEFIDSFLFKFFVNNPDIKKLYEFRHIFEIDILGLIIQHYDENEAERELMKKNLQELEDIIRINSPELYPLLDKNDIAFHRLMGKATCNPFVERVYNLIIDFIEPSICAGHRNQENGNQVFSNHKNIVQAIEDRASDRIDEVITGCVNTWSVLQA